MKLSLKKNNCNSYFMPIPIEVIRSLGVENDTEILAELKPWRPIYQKICQEAMKRKKQVKIVFGEKRKPEKMFGIVHAVDQSSVQIFSNNGTHHIPFSLVHQLEEA